MIPKNIYEDWRQAQHINDKTYEMEVFEGYEVSNMDGFRRKDNGKIIKGTPNNVGRRQVMIHKKRYQFHRIVASTFLVNDEPSVKKVVMHIDSNPKNNNVSNLKWGTQSENLSDPKRAEALKRSAGWQKMIAKSSKPIFVFDTEKMVGAIYSSNSEASKTLNIDRATSINARKTSRKVKNRYFITTNEIESNEEADKAFKILSNFKGVA